MSEIDVMSGTPFSGVDPKRPKSNEKINKQKT